MITEALAKKDVLDTVINLVISELSPENVLIVGCTASLFAEKFEEYDVTVSGILFSSDKLREIPHSKRQFFQVSSQFDCPSFDYNLVFISDEVFNLFSSREELFFENLCRCADNILIYREEMDVKIVPNNWLQLFAKQRFFYDMNSLIGIESKIWHFRKSIKPPSRIINWYAGELQKITRLSQLQRTLMLEYRNELTDTTMQLRSMEQRIKTLETTNTKLIHIENSMGWRIAQKLQALRVRVAPPSSIRDQIIDDIFLASPQTRWSIVGQSIKRLYKELVFHTKESFRRKYNILVTFRSPDNIQIKAIEKRTPVAPHQDDVAIVVCVHNAFDDVQRCLNSVVRRTKQPYRLILVDDGSDNPTKTFLEQFSQKYSTKLIRNDEALGYTFAANKGLREATEKFVVLLNSDTIVTEGWIDRMIVASESSSDVGLVGPLSNTASWQSIPKIDENGDWAENPLPVGVTVEEMGILVARYSERLYPQIPFLNGFCLLIKREVIQNIGYFDEENFGRGYGEEDDYTIRARKAGWKLALADDVYIYHAQSRSYTTEKRKLLSERSGKQLRLKHGEDIIRKGVEICRYGKVFEGIRIHSQRMFEREAWVEKGTARFSGKRLLFILPVIGPGGGANVVIDEAMAMRKMGVDVHLFNLTEYKQGFEQGYPHLQLPVFWGEPQDISILANGYDAIVATFNTSVEWLTTIIPDKGKPVLGYYIQGFEPYIYDSNSEEYKSAVASYTLISNLKRFTKTKWTREEVKKFTDADSSIIGISLNTSLFRPRPRVYPKLTDSKYPLRITAMVRPNSLYRAPKLTMELLQQAQKRYKRQVEIVIFGIEKTHSEFSQLPNKFPMTIAGILNQKQVAGLLNETDIFIDVSSHQAMGLTALEAMACGNAVIVPQNGGAVSFAHHEINSLVVDTTSFEQCWMALQRLIDDDALRTRLQQQALIDVSQYYPEKPAFKILDVLFGGQEGSI